MNNNILIRKATLSDRDSVAAIIKATDNLSEDEKDCAVELLDMYFVELDGADECGSESADTECDAEEDYLLLVAEFTGEGKDDALAGYICYGPASFADGVSEIYWIIVADGFKGRGVGRALVEYLEGILKEEGLRMLVAETSGTADYEVARSFYKKLGFVEEARIEGFFKAGDDKVFFVNRY